MPSTIALIPLDLHRTRLGLPAVWSHTLAGLPILHHTLTRLSRIRELDAIVIVHPSSQHVAPLWQGVSLHKPILTHTAEQGLFDRWWGRRTAARKATLAAWRGGLGGTTCYDELLPARPLLQAMQHHDAASALLVGGDWVFVDPELSSKVLALHLEHPDAMSMTFCQAPPGLSGIALSRKPLEQMADSDATIGQGLSYNPARPQADPIGRDVCIQVPGSVRSAAHRFIYDTPRAIALLQTVAGRLGDEVVQADALRVTQTANDLGAGTIRSLSSLPTQITLELTPRRSVNGLIVPQHHVRLERADMSVALASRLLEEVARQPDVLVTLGGLGDALLHPQWEAIVTRAAELGVFGLALDTDLLCDTATAERLLCLPLDVVTLRVNADTAPVYAQVMGDDRFKTVLENMTRLFNGRIARDEKVPGGLWFGRPWMVPRFIKTADTLPDMESFFDKWTHFLGHAVIEPATTGCGLAPDLALHNLAPPKRFACRQLSCRMTVHSDGSVALCDQDWLSRGSVGNVNQGLTLAQAWAELGKVYALHEQGRWTEHALCGACREWHRP